MTLSRVHSTTIQLSLVSPSREFGLERINGLNVNPWCSLKWRGYVTHSDLMLICCSSRELQWPWLNASDGLPWTRDIILRVWWPTNGRCYMTFSLHTMMWLQRIAPSQIRRPRLNDELDRVCFSSLLCVDFMQ